MDSGPWTLDPGLDSRLYTMYMFCIEKCEGIWVVGWGLGGAVGLGLGP